MVQASEFFNDMVSESLDLRTDFERWKIPESTPRFSYATYPFLLGAEMKSRLLQLESKIEMHIRREESAVVFRPDGVVQLDPYLELQVSRDNLIPDSLSQVPFQSRIS